MAKAVLKYLREVTVEPVLFLYMFAFYIQGPILQLLIVRKICRKTYDAEICTNRTEFEKVENEIESESSRWILYFNLSLMIPGATMATMLGPLSDRVGRKIIMTLPSFGAAFAALFFILNSYYIDWPLYTLLIGGFGMGLTGSLGTLFVSVVSYVTDITDPASRIKRLGLVESMVYIGGTIGLVSAGVVTERHGFAATFFLFLSLHLAIILYIAIYLKESLPKEQRVVKQNGSAGATNGKKPSVLMQCCSYIADSFRRALSVVLIKRKGSRRKHLLLNMVISVTGVIAQAGDMDLSILYTKHSPLSWPPSLIGIYLALRTALKGLALLAVVPLLSKMTNQSSPDKDMRWAELALVSTVAGYATMALARSTGLMMSVSVIGCLFGLTRAVQGSIATRLVESTEFGAMFACTQLVEASCLMIGSIFFNNLYRATLEFWPGFSFLVMAVLALISLIFAIYLQYDMKKDWSEEYQEKGDGVKKLLHDMETEDEDEVEIINVHNMKRTASSLNRNMIETHV